MVEVRSTMSYALHRCQHQRTKKRDRGVEKAGVSGGFLPPGDAIGTVVHRLE